MNLSQISKCFWVYALGGALLFAPLGCSYKPGYLQKSQATQVKERWKVVKINQAKLSPDEAALYEKTGPPQYVRFYRHLSDGRERVYEWIYMEPMQFVSFIDGKKLDNVVVDDNTSPWNERQKNFLFWSGITAGVAGGLGLVYYYLFAR